MAITRRAKNRSRRNQDEGASFPVGEIVDVDAVRFNADGTVSVFVEDANIPASVGTAENRRRTKNGKRKNTKRKAKRNTKKKKAKKNKRRK